MRGMPILAYIKAIALLTTLSLALSGCLSNEPTDVIDDNTNPPPDNVAPVISGNPGNAISIGDMYSFSPNASDADNDSLTFLIENKPVWASFDNGTGNLSGQPTLGNVGMYNSILISVSDGAASASLPMFSIEVAEVITNSAPTISGNPASAVNANTAYSFTPTASDPDDDALSFSIAGLPGWASFNASNGAISGTPGDGDVDIYSGITITVSDDIASANLGPFSISVNAVSLGSVTLDWTAPTENEDGSALTDLAGYKIYWGTTPGNYTSSVTVDSAGLTSYVVDNLVPGTYEFVATSYNAAGVESAYSSPATKVLN